MNFEMKFVGQGQASHRAAPTTSWRGGWRKKLQVQLGQTVVLENKAGASGNAGADAVAKSGPASICNDERASSGASPRRGCIGVLLQL